LRDGLESPTDLKEIYEDLLKYESWQNEFLNKLRSIMISSSDSVLENQETFKPFVDEFDNLINEKKNFEDAIAHLIEVFDCNSNSEILLEMSLVIKDLFSFEGEYPVVDPFEKFYMLLQILEKECEETKEYYKDLVTLVFNNMDILVKKKTNLTSMFGSRFAKKKRLDYGELKNEVFDDFFGRVVKENKALWLFIKGLKGLIGNCECILSNCICFQERFK
jgi:hypothetical protein